MFFSPAPHYFRVWTTGPPPLFEGLGPPLKITQQIENEALLDKVKEDGNGLQLWFLKTR